MIYLVDINLPRNFSMLESFNFVFIHDLSTEMPDSEIWNLAIEKNYTILTRDKDFYYRAVQSTRLPKIVLFRLGNCKNQELFTCFQNHANKIEALLAHHQLLVLWPHEIQVVI